MWIIQAVERRVYPDNRSQWILKSIPSVCVMELQSSHVKQQSRLVEAPIIHATVPRKLPMEEVWAKINCRRRCSVDLLHGVGNLSITVLDSHTRSSGTKIPHIRRRYTRGSAAALPVIFFLLKTVIAYAEGIMLKQLDLRRDPIKHGARLVDTPCEP